MNKRPLFTIDLKALTDEEFSYSTDPDEYIKALLKNYSKILDDISKIHDIEPIILHDLYKSQKNKAKIKAPIKPREKPKETIYGKYKEMENGEKKGVYCMMEDENKWVWDLCENL